MLAGDVRAGPVVAAKTDALVGDIAARPSCRPAEQVCIEAHERLVPDDDGHAFIGDVVAREGGSDGCLGVGEVRLEQAREFFLPRGRILGQSGGGSEDG